MTETRYDDITILQIKLGLNEKIYLAYFEQIGPFKISTIDDNPKGALRKLLDLKNKSKENKLEAIRIRKIILPGKNKSSNYETFLVNDDSVPHYPYAIAKSQKEALKDFLKIKDISLVSFKPVSRHLLSFEDENDLREIKRKIKEEKLKKIKNES